MMMNCYSLVLSVIINIVGIGIAKLFYWIDADSEEVVAEHLSYFLRNGSQKGELRPLSFREEMLVSIIKEKSLTPVARTRRFLVQTFL